MGPKEFLNLLQIKDISDDNAWLLPILKQHIVGASLNFFRKDVLHMCSKIQAMIPKVPANIYIYIYKVIHLLYVGVNSLLVFGYY